MTDALAGQIITGVVTITLAIIGYLKLKAGQDKLRKDVDGKMTQLLEVTGAKERAEGKAEGKTEQRSESKEDSVTATGVVDVKIVDQEKEVKVIVEKPDKTKL